MERLRVGVVFSSRGWARTLHAYASDHVTDIDVVVVRDERAALESGFHLLAVDETTPWLTASFLAQAARLGITLVGVWDRSEPAGQTRLEHLGITHRLVGSMPADEVIFLLRRLRPITAGFPAPDLTAPPVAGDREREAGTVCAVGGPPGAGAREIAIGLATVLGHTRSTLLVDANESSPGLARRLGLGLHPHLATAITAVADHDVDGLVGVLAEPMNSGFRAGFDTIVGLPTAVEWDRLTVRGVDRVLDAARSSYDLTVVCTSPVIEDLRRWVDRYAVSRHVLSVAADVTVGVCEASPRGVLRFLDWLVEYAALSGDPLTRVPVIINKLPAGRTVFGEIVGQLHAISGTRVDVIGGVPFDRRVQRAEWNANAPSRGPYTKAVAHLARQLDASLDLTRQRSDA